MRLLYVQLVGERRVYTTMSTPSIEAIRISLHAAIDVWVDEELTAWAETPDLSTMPFPRIEVR